MDRRHCSGTLLDLDPVPRYGLADAVNLPVRSGTIDLVVAYNSLMDFDDLPSAVAEIGRVLSDDGTFCICITHPLEYSGGFEGDDVDAPYLLTHYLDARSFDETFTRDGITMRFRGWARPMQEYFGALFAAGFVIDALHEPVPNVNTGRYERWHRIPMFLYLRAIKKRL